jgi:hypothetical protein
MIPLVKVDLKMFSKIIVLASTLNCDEVTLMPFSVVDVIAVEPTFIEVTVEGYDILILPPTGIPKEVLI